MPDLAEDISIALRVSAPGCVAFQLRSGEEGISVFVPTAVDPPLTEAEILENFRAGSYLIARPISAIEALGLRVEYMEGGAALPHRLSATHAEIRPGPGMTRKQFKVALKGLE